MVLDSQKLFPELIELAALQLKDRKLKWRMSVRMDLKRFLVPTQGALKARALPTPAHALKVKSPSGSSLKKDTSYYAGDPQEVRGGVCCRTVEACYVRCGYMHAPCQGGCASIFLCI